MRLGAGKKGRQNLEEGGFPFSLEQSLKWLARKASCGVTPASKQTTWECTIDKQMETQSIIGQQKSVNLIAPPSFRSLSRELSDPADCQSPCHSCHTGTRQHTLTSGKCLIEKDIGTNLVREGSDVLSLVEVERSCLSLQGK